MCLSAIMALFSSLMIGGLAQDDPDMPFVFKIFPLLAVVQISIAVLGLISGIHFLKFKVWSRGILEGLTWLHGFLDLQLGVYEFGSRPRSFWDNGCSHGCDHQRNLWRTSWDYVEVSER
jgi:hypothetical protein